MTEHDPPITLEVCVDSPLSGTLAAKQGAQRIELNTALELGGLTPSIGLVEHTIAVLQPMDCGLIAMVRPRPGGFAYHADDLAVMQREIAGLLDAGVDGVALGVLKKDSTVDESANRALIQPVLDAGRDTVFHRAFDLTLDPIAAIDTLIDLGFTRVLTSGQAPTAVQGVSMIRRLVEHADGRIEVLPGSGVTPGNAVQLVRETGCTQVHASLRQVVEDRSGSHRPAIRFSSPPPEHGFHQVDPEKVTAMVEALNDMCSG